MAYPLSVPLSALVPAPHYTIWAHQVHFQAAAQASAADIFGELDEDLEPNVVLLGIATDGSDVMCLEPDSCSLPLSAFEQVLARGRQLQKLQPVTAHERELFGNEALRRRRESIGLRLAVQEVLDELEADGETQSFASLPVRVESFLVLVVLRVPRRAMRLQPALQPHRYYIDGRPLATSLVKAAMLRFNEECVKSLMEPVPGLSLVVRPRDADEVIRSAGRLFMDTPAQALGTDPAVAKLFPTLNTISSLRYEGTAGEGQIMLARRHHPNIREIFALTCPTPLTDYRAVRKLLQMTTADVSLLSDGENVYALGKEVGDYDAAREDLFTVAFLSHFVWEIRHANRVLLRSAYGQPSLPRTRLSRGQFRRGLRQTFGLTDSIKVERLWDVLLEASRQADGTLVVITTEALAEADRLKLQCTLIEPVQLTPLITRLVTAIDGAVLLDPDAYCYSIGVILDGKATGRGSSTRGARYNSALRYVESTPYPCMAIVVSEDGLVDIITKENLPERAE